jgi:Adenine/guanine phosphoribosyltransferases and related PRPP-binding proteins
MGKLKDYITENSVVLSNKALDVSNFLNMQVDPKLMQEIGENFATYYSNYNFDAFITVEASGIAPSIMASLYLKKPLIIIKKMYKTTDTKLQQPCFSFTKNQKYYLTVDEKFIKNKKLVLIDDFLAEGNVVINVEKLLQKTNAELISTGIIISKNFQNGYKYLKDAGKDIYCLVELETLNPKTQEIIFAK